jgi:hypothetical protein
MLKLHTGCGETAPSKLVSLETEVAHTNSGSRRSTRTRRASIAVDGAADLPMGPPIKASAKKSELLYNEYIVYNAAQARLRFLVKVRFDFKSGRRRR